MIGGGMEIDGGFLGPCRRINGLRIGGQICATSGRVEVLFTLRQSTSYFPSQK